MNEGVGLACGDVRDKSAFFSLATEEPERVQTADLFIRLGACRNKAA